MLTVVDEYSRECLSIVTERSLKSDDVLDCLTEMFIRHGIPEYIRSDNGSEFTAKMVRRWLSHIGVQTLYIEPGCSWENGYNKRFNGKFRDELLNGEIFYTLKEAKVLIEKWRLEYKHVQATQLIELPSSSTRGDPTLRNKKWQLTNMWYKYPGQVNSISMKRKLFTEPISI